MQILVGIAAALLAVGLRYLLPLSPIQLPVLTVVVAVAITSTFVGLASGIATAVLGGLLSWYVFFMPVRWELGSAGIIPLFGFSVTASVIIITTHLYRRSEQRIYQAEVAILQRQAEASELFAREMAHRLKNALAIVQSIAFQTLDDETPAAATFAARLKALADANDLLNEHVERPTADVADVVKVAVQPFAGVKQRVHMEFPDVKIAARQVVLLALGLHELCTNAVKYGALSNEAGWVSLKIEDLGDCIELVWKERDGPPVAPPEANGFGMSLLRRVGSDPQLLFEPDGLRCSMRLRKA
jgi:two-component sensor histidine kinase